MTVKPNRSLLAFLGCALALPGAAERLQGGPMRAFGNVNFPAWGTSRDGGWRWTYTTVDLSTDPIPATVQLDPPNH